MQQSIIFLLMVSFLFASPVMALPGNARVVTDSLNAQSTTATVTAVTVTPTPDTTQTAAAVTPSPSPTPKKTFSVRGNVIMPGGTKLPDGLTVVLTGSRPGVNGSNSVSVFQATSPLSSDGTYHFDSIDIISGMTIEASILYHRLSFRSKDVSIDDPLNGKTIVLPITIHETTTDPNGAVVKRLHVILSFDANGNLQIAEMYIISNPTDKVIVPADPTGSVLNFDLPNGASNLQFSDGSLGDRFISTNTGFGDRSPIYPEQDNQVVFVYSLPYHGQTSLSLKSPLQVEDVMAMLPSDGVQLHSAQLTSSGERNVEGSLLNLYTANRLPGDSLDIQLSGSPSLPASHASPAQETAIGLAALLLVAICGGIWLSNRRKPALVAPSVKASPETSEELMDQILFLDDLHKAGKLEETTFQTRRAELKERLRVLLKEKPGS
jgi:hypothetical protein